VQVRKTTVDIKASISCDQIIANKIGSQTRFASLELGMDDSRQAGDCDSGVTQTDCDLNNGGQLCRQNLVFDIGKWRHQVDPVPDFIVAVASAFLPSSKFFVSESFGNECGHRIGSKARPS
jgi:hypothetical protein